MKIEDVKSNKNWEERDGFWVQKTTYWCKARRTTRIKFIKHVVVKCGVCEQDMLQNKQSQNKYKRAYCSPECRRDSIKKNYSGKNHMSWNGGKYKKDGYIFVKCAGHHLANKNGYVREHILIAEGCEGRQLESFEVVHHKDEIRDNNEPFNLQIMSDTEHRRYHALKNKLGRRV